MKHLVMVTVFAVLVGLGADVAHAQPRASTPAPASAVADHAYGEFTVGPTFGHKSNVSFGGEGGYWFSDFVGVFGEVGHMRDVATTNIENHARRIASTFGGTTTSTQPATYLDGGVAVRVLTTGRFTPYALLGFGFAHVSNNVRFAVGGVDVTSQLAQFGVQLGGDLSGSYNSRFITVGAGTHISFAPRWIADVSYRYGSIGENSDAELNSINTNRIQFGVGAKF